MHIIRIWDLPTRVFHWVLLLAVVGAFITGKVGGSWMVWHSRFGYAVLTLVLFRLVWGLVGGRWSRFTAFIYSPRSLLRYWRGEAPAEHKAGHNPMGALSVFALLAVLAAQTGSGLFTDDEIAFTGPLNRFVSSAQGLWLTWYHKQVGQWLLVALVTLHVAAVLFYLLARHENLVAPMLHGDKQLPQPVAASRDDTATRLAALIILAACAGLVYWIASLGG